MKVGLKGAPHNSRLWTFSCGELVVVVASAAAASVVAAGAHLESRSLSSGDAVAVVVERI